MEILHGKGFPSQNIFPICHNQCLADYSTNVRELNRKRLLTRFGERAVVKLIHVHEPALSNSIIATCHQCAFRH